ncbi:MAG: leucyl aminopeptidase family protein [Myxococcales bacterium]|nr:leucyl aminopeptidase family protein [Myxococcales bacterium]
MVIARPERVELGLALLPPGISSILSHLSSEIQAGLTGSVATTLTFEGIRRLSLGVLSSPGSRYNCPARPDLIVRFLQMSDLLRDAHTSVIIYLEDLDHLEGTLTGIARGFPIFDRRSGPPTEPRVHVMLVGPDGKPIRLPVEEKKRVQVIRTAAALVDTPPSELHPENFASKVKKNVEDLPRVTVKELYGPALARHGLRGLQAVGKASIIPPRLICATYRPVRPRGPHVAMVGKGVTFDTGGLHLKERGHMEGMKYDMAGAAAVLGAFQLLADMGVAMQMSLILCLAENAVGPASYKPDDILTLHSGKTVEINNTDAEGRLILADGLSYAARSLGAKILIDTATLTGAQLVATGTQHAAIISNDPALETLFVEAGRASGDLVHPLPFAPEFYQMEFRSPLADMRNSVKNRLNAQSSCAAQFIWSHIETTNVRWAHVDLAGPAWLGERGTGFGVSLVTRVVRSLSPPARSTSHYRSPSNSVA